MAHEIVDWNGIGRKTWIRISDKRWQQMCSSQGFDPDNTWIEEMTVLTKNKKKLILSLRVISGHLNHDITLEVDREDYECSFIDSPDFKNRKLYCEEPSDVWSQCEQNYGINHLGNKDPDPLRQLAFAILRGDGIALDAARDIVKS